MNKDVQKRDTIIFGAYEPAKYTGGLRLFNNLDVNTLGKLLDEGFADPRERQNEAPSIKRIYNFMRQYPEYKAHGYVVEAERPDCRISVEGVEKQGGYENRKELSDFCKLFGHADELTADAAGMYCWFD